MKRTIPLVGELRDDPTERRLTPAEQDAERERQHGEQMVERARRFAIERHAGQLYGDAPYETHLAAVVQVLVDFGFISDGWRAAAWLHDVIEDTDTDLFEIRTKFGPGVAAAVRAVTGIGANRTEHNAAIYLKLAERPSACPLKLADRIANVEAAKGQPRHLGRYRAEQDAFADVIKPHVPVAMWERLERALAA